MAENKVTQSDVTVETPVALEQLNLDALVTVKSISNWETGFARQTSVGDVSIAPNGMTRLSRNEIIAQVQSGNKLFVGSGGGDHATLYIDDKDTREYLGLSNAQTFNDKLVKDVFAIKSQEEFEKTVEQTFYTRAEQFALIEAIKRLKLNDYSKIRYVEKYTGFKVQ